MPLKKNHVPFYSLIKNINIPFPSQQEAAVSLGYVYMTIRKKSCNFQLITLNTTNVYIQLFTTI